MKIKEHKNILKLSNKKYAARASRYGMTSKAVFWDDQQTQYLRFFELIKNLNLDYPDKTILDVGCGNCELYKFLNFMGFRGEYTGYDINKNLIKQACQRFKNIDVHAVDITTHDTTQHFNYVVMSGLFNLNCGQSTKWVQAFLKKMYSLCTDIMVFNAISTHVNYRDKELRYFDPAKTVSFCIENLSPRVTLTHHDLPYNFTIAVFKNYKWDSINNQHE